MACPQNGPCLPFATEADLCCLAPTGGAFPDPCLTGGQPVPQTTIDNALQAASELLWAATGRRYGVCEVTIRPCRKDCNPCPGTDFFDVNNFGYGFNFPFAPYLIDGIWFNLPPCNCPGSCGCTPLQEINLPYPVCNVSEVKIDGVALPVASYRVDEFRKLVRLDGEPWPTCQNLELADTEVGTFSITLTYGRPVPALLIQATAALACEFIKACVGAPCQLPQRISTLSRQGVTVGFIDPQEFWRDKRTGIYLVDLAVDTLNPHRLTRRPTIYSPDMGSNWRRTDT